MDKDLWGPPDNPESNSSMQPEWECDFCFGCGFDEIEEDALNERYCIRVLRILIRKADTEIDKLEQDLISLQSELAWVENEEWSQICSNALKEKISCLDISVKSLRNKDKNDVEVHLLMHTQPVETLHEILNALLVNYFYKKDEQPKEVKDATILNSSSVVPRETINIVDENKTLGDYSSEFIMREEMRKSSSTTEHAAILNPCLKLEEKKTNNPKTVKPANAGVKDSNSHSMKLAAGQSDEILSSYYGPKNTRKGESREHGFNPKGSRIIKISSSKSADEGRCYVEMTKLQSTNVGVSNSISGASGHPVGNSSKKKKLSNSDSIIVSEEVEEHNSISTDDVILGSSLKSVVKKTDPSKMVKFAGTVVKNVSAKELRCATGLHGRIGNADSGLGTCSNPDIEQKLSDLSLKAACKQTMKELKVAGAEIVDSPLKTQGKEKNPPQIVKVVEAALTETENCALTSLLELQDKKGTNAIKLLPKEEGEDMLEFKMSEIGADEKKFNLDLSHDFQEKRAKKIIKQDAPIIQEIGFTTMAVDSSSSFVSEGKKQQKSGLGPLNASLNEHQKTTKIVLQLGECESKENSAYPVDSPNSVSQPQNKRKRNTNFPIIAEAKDFTVQMDFSDSQRDTTDGLNKDDQSVAESCLIHDSSSVTVASMPSASILEKMKLPELRDIAKRYKLRKYYKLPKKELLQQLASKIDNC
ncbi:hypothetical protein P3X46_009242 [Hevea brasiliensis]|uniref:Rho termination factor N-terminal domain-containing protein n=1 Tax=Hevea brasiliensis TaxID=3981 RepID=A0ABQ9MQB0_HEVBR|nr:uncharacterized protein LOC110662729 isoform X1 [Hevea brasiliensis]XP_021677499.2 uncharacterized protein LOC110662729 isoform X1 [Hevea brasiliensis]XP_021677501.2 uncharacterized protein LOC110662729 isoform X1 [Hevea brasiliensis]XP_021677502.2 uncharacterized protein LOC110662729 isoform X1 [Hevea brasiliensis]KAJ9181073.1 hypothetical protein P3X46_009242 [Hevea brasiliensis]